MTHVFLPSSKWLEVAYFNLCANLIENALCVFYPKYWSFTSYTSLAVYCK